MQFNRVNNKERLSSPSSHAVSTHMRMCWNCTCSWIVALAWCMYRRRLLWRFCSVAAHCPGSSPPTPFRPSFHCFKSAMDACLSYCMGAHGWIARIYQPWEQSLPRSSLPIVEAPGYFRHPTSILATQFWLSNLTCDSALKEDQKCVCFLLICNHIPHSKTKPDTPYTASFLVFYAWNSHFQKKQFDEKKTKTTTEKKHNLNK